MARALRRFFVRRSVLLRVKAPVLPPSPPPDKALLFAGEPLLFAGQPMTFGA